MLNAVDPKCKPWETTKSELRSIAEDGLSPRRKDHSMCLMHGFHHQVTYSFKDPIRCIAFRSNSVREEFLINHGTGPGNVLHLQMFTKGGEGDISPRRNTLPKKTESYTNRFPISCPPLQHIVWVPKHRLFVAIGSDKNLRVFSDTLHRCQIISEPTVCAMPVTSMVYLPETDEIVTGGIAIIQPWKLRISNTLKHLKPEGLQKDTLLGRPFLGNKNLKKKQTLSIDVQGMPPSSENISFGHGLQMLQPTAPYLCDLHRDDWVTHMTVYSGCEIGEKQPLLMAMCQDVVLAIDYVNKIQMWTVRLNNPDMLGPSSKQLKKKRKHIDSIEKYFDGSHRSKAHVVHGHVSLTRCDFFPRFGYFISGGAEGSIRIMHMVNFGLVTVLRGHRGPITGLVAHRLHPLLISASTDGSIRMWCLETFKLTQRLDTGQNIQNLCLSTDLNFVYFYSKQQITLYRLTSIYSLFSVLHSSTSKLTRVTGCPEMGVPGKVLAALDDGSVAVISPVTGLVLSMIYPMTSFQVFSDSVYDSFSNLVYIRLQNGSVMQCDCSTNPCCPMKVFAPSIQYDQDVSSLALVCFKMNTDRATSAVFAGLRNGQIALLHPNTFYMPTMQAHNGFVRFIGSVKKDCTDKNGSVAAPCCKEYIISVGLSTVRSWKVEIKSMPQYYQSEWSVTLQPQYRAQLPTLFMEPVYLTVLPQRLCISTAENQILVFSIEQQDPQNSPQPLVEGKSQLKTHHNDDDHVASISAMESAMTLNCFASASVDGYVKIWDEDNRLLREMCFSPHPVTALCFVNGRDLLVALGGKICLVDCTTYVTRMVVQERRMLDIDFVDDINEGAIPYDNNIKPIFNIHELPMAPLEALQRTLMADAETDIVTRKMTTEGMLKPRRKITPEKLCKPKLEEIIKLTMLRLTTEKAFNGGTAEKELRLKWRKVCKKALRSLHDVSSEVKDDLNKHIKQIETKSTKTVESNIEIKELRNAINANKTHIQEEFIINEEISNIDIKPTCHIETSLSNEAQNLNENIKQTEDDPILTPNKHPIAPDGYIPNSVIREIVRPPTPKFTSIQEWKLQVAPNISPIPLEEVASSQHLDESESSLHLDFSISFSDVDSIADLSVTDSTHEDFIVDGKLPSLAANQENAKDTAIKKVLFFDDIQQRTEVFEGNRQQNLRFKDQRDNLDGRNVKRGVPTRTSRSDLSANIRSSEVKTLVSANMTANVVKQLAMKEKLMKQRSEAVERLKVEKARVHPVLKSITDAPWFRKKLDKITPDAVVTALIEIGETTRIFAHEKACENILAIFQEFDIKEGGGKEILSPESLTNVQNFITKFILPSYDKDNEIANHTNRVSLAHNALDAIISGIQPNKAIQRELFRLIADIDESLKEKAKLILEVKFGVNSWDRLQDELSILAGDAIVHSAEHLFKTHREVLNHMEDRLKKGEVTLASAPLIAMKLGFEIIPDPSSPINRTSSQTLSLRHCSSVFGRSSEQTVLKYSSEKFKSVQKKDSSVKRAVQFNDVANVEKGDDMHKYQKRVYDDIPPPPTRPQIPWRSAIPKKSLDQRRISGIIQMMTSTPSAAAIRRFSNKETRSDPSISGSNDGSECGDTVTRKFTLPPIWPNAMKPDMLLKQNDSNQSCPKLDDKPLLLPQIQQTESTKTCKKPKKAVKRIPPKTTNVPDISLESKATAPTESDVVTPELAKSATLSDVDELHKREQEVEMDELLPKDSSSQLSRFRKSSLSLEDVGFQSNDSVTSTESSTIASVPEETSLHREGVLLLPSILNVADSGFKESTIHTTESNLESKASEEQVLTWRESLHKLKECRKDKNGKEVLINQMRDTKSMEAKKDEKLQRIISKTLFAPGERILSQCRVDKQILKRGPTYVRPLPSRTGAHTCLKNGGDSRYGVLLLGWKNGSSDKKCSSLRQRTPMTCDSCPEVVKASASRYHDDEPTSNTISCSIKRNNDPGCRTNVERNNRLRKILDVQRKKQQELIKRVDADILITHNQAGKKFLHLKLPCCNNDTKHLQEWHILPPCISSKTSTYAYKKGMAKHF